MQEKILVAGVFLLSLMFPLKVTAQNYEEIYVFGDSFSDTGNVFSATARAIPPSPTYFEGRFSNGSVWVEYLAQELGLSFNSGTNFAFGGATTGIDNISITGLPGLQHTINSFTRGKEFTNSDALYIVWAGANDYFSYFLGDVPNPNHTVTNLSASINLLAAIGAKDIMVVNLPDLGRFPVAYNDSQTPAYLSSLTSAHNSSLQSNVNFLNQQLSSDISIIPLDVNSLFNRIITEPEKFGLANVSDYCIKNLSVVPVDLLAQPVTCNPDEFLFWDPIHPTTATHKLIGELAFSALWKASIPEPSTGLGVFTFSALGAVLLRKRK